MVATIQRNNRLRPRALKPANGSQVLQKEKDRNQLKAWLRPYGITDPGPCPRIALDHIPLTNYVCRFYTAWFKLVVNRNLLECFEWKAGPPSSLPFSALSSASRSLSEQKRFLTVELLEPRARTAMFVPSPIGPISPYTRPSIL